MKLVNHKVYDKDNNLIKDEMIEIDEPEHTLESISKQTGLSIPDLLSKVKDYLEK